MKLHWRDVEYSIRVGLVPRSRWKKNWIPLQKVLGMDAQATEVLFGFFADLPDPRRHNVRHLFGDILAIAILAVMCRADDWSEIVPCPPLRRPC